MRGCGLLLLALSSLLVISCGKKPVSDEPTQASTSFGYNVKSPPERTNPGSSSGAGSGSGSEIPFTDIELTPADSSGDGAPKSNKSPGVQPSPSVTTSSTTTTTVPNASSAAGSPNPLNPPAVIPLTEGLAPAQPTEIAPDVILPESNPGDIPSAETPVSPEGSDGDPSIVLPAPLIGTSSEMKNQAQGFVDGGRLLEPASLLERQYRYRTQAPFKVAAPNEKRFYGTDELIEAIDYLGHYLTSLLPKLKLLVSAMSQYKGGSVPPHMGHQNGMEVDMAYFAIANETRDVFINLEEVNINKRIYVDEQFQFFKHAMSLDMVDRFFIYPQLKREFCRRQYAELKKDKPDAEIVETLRRLVPDPNHVKHFHMRLKCGPRQLNCKDSLKKPLPEGSGCIFAKKAAN